MADSTLDSLLAGADSALAEHDNPATPPISGPGDTYVPSASPDQPRPAIRVYITKNGDQTGTGDGVVQEGVPGGTAVGGVANTGAPIEDTGGPSGTASTTTPQLQPSGDAQAKYLDQLDQLAAQAMQEGGFSGYVPPIETAVKTPEGQNSLTNAMQDFGAGFNYELAKSLSLPRETVNQALGLLGFDYMEKGKITQQTVNAIARLGVPIYQVENEANKLGQGALPALATWAAIQLAAPQLAAQTGTTAFQMVAREIGDWALKHPILGFWMGQTQTAGGTLARDTFGDNDLVGLAGELAGGSVSSGVNSLARKVVSNPATRLLGRGINAAVDWAGAPTAFRNAVQKYNPLYQVPAKPFAEAVVDSPPDIAHVQQYAEDQVAGLKMQMDDAVARAVDSVKSTGDAGVQQRVMHANLVEAEKISNSLVEKVWQKVDQTIRIPVKDMFRGVIDFRNSLRDTPSVRPNAFINEALRLSRPMRDPTTGRIIPSLPTVRRVRDFLSSIRTEVVREQASDAPRDGYIRNLNRLAAIVEDNIANQFPQNTRLAQARAASTLHHDMFSRGPIADILAKKYRGDYRIDPSESVEALTRRPDGVKAVRDMVRTLSANPLIGKDDKKIVQAVQQDMENALRNMWREEAAKSPNKAVQFNARIQGQIKALARVAAELQTASDKVGTAQGIKDDIEKSALARYAATTADKAIKNLFSQARNTRQVVEQLIRTFSGDRQALRGLQSGIVAELIARSKGDPVNMRALLSQHHIHELVSSSLSASQRVRLNRIVNDSIRLTSGEDQGFVRHNFLRFSLLGRIIGAWVGRSLPGTTLQGQAILARGGAKLAERLFKATPPEQMMKLAIIDPAWEQMLYSRFPTTVKEMRIAARHYRRLYGVIDNERRDAQKALGMGQ